MDRKTFLKTLALLTGTTMNLKGLSNLSNTEKMPVLFLGHGSPMNAIEENEFVQGFRKVSSEIKKPNAVLCISAHWETRGTKITAMENPRTIHDFGGFPKQLFDVQYPAPGHPKLAQETKKIITSSSIELDNHWGLDHGAWSVIKHMYPDADIPVIQLSLDINKSPAEHYQMTKELSQLRDKGILIIGSGNLVHNLRMIDWKKLNTNYGYDWAKEANEKMIKNILNRDHHSLMNYTSQGKEFQLSIPTPEHYLPLLYTTALQNQKEEVSLFNNKFIGGSLSMTSVKIG